MDEIVRTLYALPPDEFIAARDDAAHQEIDQRTAAQIGKLRKPTVAAWLVNLLAIQRPDLLAELAELSNALRAAQRELRGAELRELSGRRRAAISGLVEESRRLALAARPALARKPGSLPLAEVEQTLQAALADLEAAEVVRSGRLVRAIEYAGFGEVPRPQLRLVTNGLVADRPATDRPATNRSVPDEPGSGSGQPGSDQATTRSDRTTGRREAERELTAARTADGEARAELDRATAAEDGGARALAELDEELVGLRARRAEADAELGRRKVARKAAERAVAAARRRVGEAEATLEAGAAEPR